VGRDGDWRPDPQRESVASGLTPSSRSWEKIEWFYRYRWNAGESQVDLHILFQPAFSQRPQTRVDVVEGVGKVTISDLQPHGVRLQLKRTYPPAAEAEVTSVIWLEAIGSSS
jgi:hypothetical protein